MKAVLFLAVVVLCTGAGAQSKHAVARTSRISVPGASLYCREVGQGTPMIVLHGGPDFDISYLLPELDRLSDKFHLIYDDQRGRGRSADYVKPAVDVLKDLAADQFYSILEGKGIVAAEAIRSKPVLREERR
ncbi:MAG TPA: hypothetical protein VKB81_19580 [Nitrospira sp.]|nr:hypothetical protein [Nitrospira sp.]